MSITLRYFPLRALAEPTKITLEYGNVPYTEEVVQFADWGGSKKKDPSFTVFGQVPAMLLPTGQLLSQSAVILRYAGYQARAVPPNEPDRLNCEMIAELAKDMNAINAVHVFHPNGSDAMKAAKEKFFAEAPAQLEAATRLLGTKPFFGGANPSYGDFAFFHILDQIMHVEVGYLMVKFPALYAFEQRVAALPQLAKYFATRVRNAGAPGSLINPVVAAPKDAKAGKDDKKDDKKDAKKDDKKDAKAGKDDKKKDDKKAAAPAKDAKKDDKKKDDKKAAAPAKDAKKDAKAGKDDKKKAKK